MGVWHLAGVGTSPGAVTSALAYLKNEKDKFKGFKGKIIDSLVLFTSQEVASGRASVKEYVINKYMSTQGQKMQGNFNVLEVIREFIDKEIKDVMPKKAKCYLCVVNIEDYQDCFENVAKVLLKFSPPDAVGKNIWANLTGGTNILNAAIMQAAFLSGLISRAYYTYVSPGNEKYLQPFTRDSSYFMWDEIELIKTTPDQAYYEILRILNEVDNFMEDEKLLFRLKNGNLSLYFQNINISRLRREFLNKMDSSCIDRLDNTNKCKINEYGKELLKMLDDPLIKTLTERGKGNYRVSEPDLKVICLKVIWEKIN